MRHLGCMLLLVLVSASAAYAQVDRKEVRSGNRSFRKGEYREAEIGYMKALLKDSLSFAANYNLGSALYRQEEYGKAREALEKVAPAALASPHGADLYFNLGDAAIAQKDWKTAVDAFMHSLLLNPDDVQAKENFIYARKMLENSQGGGQGDQDNKDSQNNKDNQNDEGDRNDDNDRDNDGNRDDQKNQDGNDDKDDRSQDNRDGDGQQQAQLTPQAAQQMLQAIQAKEKETQDKVQKAKALAAKSRQKEKNW